MRKYKIIALALLAVLFLIACSVFAKTLELNHIIDKLSNPHITSLQKFDAIGNYKGMEVTGNGQVKDILRYYGDETKVNVYLEKIYNSKKYEMILTVDKKDIEGLRKGRRVAFIGKFSSYTLESIRFDEAKILTRRFGIFKFY